MERYTDPKNNLLPAHSELVPALRTPTKKTRLNFGPRTPKLPS